MVPVAFHEFETFLLRCQLVAEFGCQLKVLHGDGFVLHLLQVGAEFFFLHDVLADGYVGQMSACAGLVHGVDGLVGQAAVGHISFREAHAGLQGSIGVAHVVMVLVALLEVLEYLHRLIGGGRLYEHFLETAFEGAILLDALLIFVDGGGADALHLSSGEGGLEHVGGIHRPGSRTGTDDGMYLIDEKDDLGVLCELIDDGFEAFLELSAVLRACHDTREVEHDDALVKEQPGHLTCHDALCQAFHDGALAHAGQADEDGVVLLPAAQDLCHALYLALTSYDGIEQLVVGRLCEVGAEGVEGRRAALALAGTAPCGGLSG